jgi:hypothetical protein
VIKSIQPDRLNLKGIPTLKRIRIVSNPLGNCTPLTNVDEILFYPSQLTNLDCCVDAKIVTIISRLDEHIFDIALINVDVLDKFTFFFGNAGQLKNYHLLDKLNQVSISHCISIIDVTCFQNIPSLRLIYCPNISDVSSLGKVHELDLTCCSGIRDVSALKDVHTLILNGCRNVHDVSSLGGIHKLDVSHCPLIRNISSLHSIYDLTIVGFTGNDILTLRNIKILDIPSCSNITDVSSLKDSLEELSIHRCRKITNIPMLHKLRILGASYGVVVDFSGLRSLKKLTMSPVGYLEPCSFVGTETFSQLKTLFLGETEPPLHRQPFPFQTSFQQAYSWLHTFDFKNLRSLTIWNSTLTEIPGTLSHLHTLRIHDYSCLILKKVHYIFRIDIP